MADPGKYAIDLADLKYAPLATDTGNAGPTYGALVDLSAAAEMTLTPEEGDTRELRGDGGVVQSSVARGATKGTLRFGGIQPAALAALYGHHYWQQGTTPNIIRVLRYKPLASRPYVKIEGQALNNDVGDTHMVFWKVQVDGEAPELTLQDGEWAAVEIPVTLNDTVATDGQTVTLSAQANSGATSLPVNALTKFIPSGTALVFGGTTATTTADAVPGATTIACAALSGTITSGSTAVYTGPVLKWEIRQNETAVAIA